MTKSHTRYKKKNHILIKNFDIYKLLKDLYSNRKRTNSAAFICHRPLSSILKYRELRLLQQSWKQGSFRHILKNLANIYKSSGLPFLRTTMEHSVDHFFLRSAGKEMKEKRHLSHQDYRFEKRFSREVLSYQMQNTTPHGLNKGDIADVLLLTTLLKNWERS